MARYGADHSRWGDLSTPTRHEQSRCARLLESAGRRTFVVEDGESSAYHLRPNTSRAIQFNFVVSTNEGAIRLYKNYGFDIIGTLPLAFRHPKRDYVDVLVMFKTL